MDFKPPSELKLTGNVGENWKKWSQKLNNYLVATEKVSKSKEVKTAVLLNLVGDEAVEVYNTFKFDKKGDETDFDIVIQKFEGYCVVKKNVVYERHKFFKCTRHEGQTLDTYLTNLKTLAANCEFETQEEPLIRDQLILNVGDAELQERILVNMGLASSSKSLDSVVDFIRVNEISKEQVKTIQNQNTTSVDSIYGKKSSFNVEKNRKFKSQSNEVYECKKCGTQHAYGQCPAYGKRCHKCNKLHHFVVGCKFKVNTIQNNNESEDDGDFVMDCDKPKFVKESIKLNIGAISNKNVAVDMINRSREWNEKIHINNLPVNFKLDCGAECNVLPANVAKKLGITRLRSTNATLEMFGGFYIKPIGIVNIQCKVNERSSFQNFYVVKEANTKPLLGLIACEYLGLIKRVYALDQSNFQEKNWDVFNPIPANL